ncbi:MAG: cyclic nucleotide-binding domain-containing protein, partial [Pseudomonadota bacterium]
MEFRQFLDSLPAFDGLPAADVDVLLAVLQREQYDAGRIFFSQGGSTRSLYLLLEGGVRVCYSDEQGVPIEAAELRSGEFFGLLGLIGDIPATATALATSSVHVASLDCVAYQDLFARAPVAARR